MKQKIKGNPLRNCEICKLNDSLYCRECYDFDKFVGAQTELTSWGEEAIKA